MKNHRCTLPSLDPIKFYFTIAASDLDDHGTGITIIDLIADMHLLILVIAFWWISDDMMSRLIKIADIIFTL